jgi:hypothetical protein
MRTGRNITEHLHRLIDSGAPQPQINERMVAVMEKDRSDVATVAASLTDHEKRIRYIERTLAWGLGIMGGIGTVTGLVVTLVKIFK